MTEALSDVVVTGGVTGIHVRADELVRVAQVLADVGLEVGVVAAVTGSVLAERALEAAALLDPSGAARASAAVLAAVAGPSGALAAAVALQVRAGQLVVAAARYTAADRLEGELRDLRRWAQGSAAVLALPALPALAVVGGGWAAVTLTTGGDPVDEAEDWLADHPGVVDEVTGSLPAAVTGLTGALLGPLAAPADAVLRATTGRTLLPRDLAESAALLALLYPRATPEVELAATGSAAAPTGLGGLVAGLTASSAGARGAQQGAVVVRRLVRPDADAERAVSWVVDVPGTKDWQLDPRTRPYVNDLASNLELVSGEPTVRVEAVREALRQAGARSDDPVLLVGHSQGGLVAARAAAALQGDYAVSHVVTVGSPVARVEVPEAVRVLSMENRQDLVPRLDAAPNPDRASRVTVAFDAPAPTLAAEHDLELVYAPAAAALDPADHPAVREWLRSAEAFLAAPGEATTVTTSTYVVRNGAPP